MLTALSVENRIRTALKDLNISATQFAFFTGGYISQQRLTEAFNGLRPLPNDVGTRLEIFVQELQELAASVAPLTIDYRNVLAVKQVLEERRAAKHDAELARQ
jgi:hypothetical protein